jgi:hypothetical protein
MPTVHREERFQVRIFYNDHPPPHVHVVKGSGYAKTTIPQGEIARLIEARGLANRDIVRAVRIVEGQQEGLFRAWVAIHGKTDPDR